MKKLSILTCTMIALASFMATNVQAGPHFNYTTPSLDTSTGDYCVSFKEAGLGSTPVTFTITAGATFTFQCFTKSSNTPQGAPNSVSFSAESNQQTLTPRNGQITSTLCLEPQQDCASCQGGGLVLKLIHVEYTAGTFCDSTNGVCVDTPAKGGDVSPAAKYPSRPAGCP
jgi:hypothetical protein